MVDGHAGIVSGVFDDRARAEQAVTALKRAGFGDDQIGVVQRGAVRGEDIPLEAEMRLGNATAAGLLDGGVIGGLVGAVAVVFIPGVGPLLAGGILAGALEGVVVGATAGGLMGIFAHLGIADEHARRYERAVQDGHVVVTVRAGERAAQAVAALGPAARPL